MYLGLVLQVPSIAPLALVQQGPYLLRMPSRAPSLARMKHRAGATLLQLPDGGKFGNVTTSGLFNFATSRT